MPVKPLNAAKLTDSLTDTRTDQTGRQVYFAGSEHSCG